MIIIVLTVLGLCFGSFVNALVWRLHQQATIKGQKGKKAKRSSSLASKDLSIIKGRSMCVHCHHELAPLDLIPVVSWLLLGGKCRYCHKKIEDSPLVELLTAGLFITSYLLWPFAFNDKGITLFVFWLIFLVGFMAMIIYDVLWLILPDRIVFPLFILAAVQVLVVSLLFDGGTSSILMALGGMFIGGGLFYVLFQISKGRWIGGGDVKLGAVLGLIVGGPMAAILMIFSASLIGTVVSVPLLATGKAKANTRLPFGPFLIAATIIVYLLGAGIIDWYKTKLLYY